MCFWRMAVIGHSSKALPPKVSFLYFWMAVPGHEHIYFTFFWFEWQFPAINILILLFFCFKWQLPAMNKLILLFFVLNGSSRPWTNYFYFCFYSLLFLSWFHNKNILFCFENNNKKESISSSIKNKMFLHCTFTLFPIQNN